MAGEPAQFGCDDRIAFMRTIGDNSVSSFQKALRHGERSNSCGESK